MVNRTLRLRYSHEPPRAQALITDTNNCSAGPTVTAGVFRNDYIRRSKPNDRQWTDEDAYHWGIVDESVETLKEQCALGFASVFFCALCLPTPMFGCYIT